MTITLVLPPETEQTLLAQAKAKGVALDVYLQTVIAKQAAAADPVRPLPAIPRDGEELDRSIDELFDTVPVPPGVVEGAVRRENWYR